MKNSTNLVILIVALVVGFAIGRLTGGNKPEKIEEAITEVVPDVIARDQAPTDIADPTPNEQKELTQDVPVQVFKVLEYVKEHGMPMEGYVGGKQFGNYEGHLPKTDVMGDKIEYREWDVNPKVEGQNRGAERIVTGSDGRAWYTKDHYESFIQVKK